jgi:hypothetical protein
MLMFYVIASTIVNGLFFTIWKTSDGVNIAIKIILLALFITGCFVSLSLTGYIVKV